MLCSFLLFDAVYVWNQHKSVRNAVQSCTKLDRNPWRKFGRRSSFGKQTTAVVLGKHDSFGSQPFRSRPFRSLELSFPGAKLLGNFRSRGARPMSITAYRRRPSHLRERKSQTSKVPGNEMAMKRKGQGGNWPGSELARVLLADSLQGTNWPGSEKARYHSFNCNHFVNVIHFLYNSDRMWAVICQMP